MDPVLAPQEEARLDTLRQYQILDTPQEGDFDDLVKLAAEICRTPISLVSLVDRDRQWFKGRYGLHLSETPRRVSFCSHAIQQPDKPMVIPDATRDPRFAENELVTSGPRIRFYAGVPLVTPEGHALGTLCVIDHRPRHLNASQLEALRVLARQVLTQLELRRRLAELGRASTALADANTELEGFYHAVSHDLRSPLRATTAYAQMLLRRFADGLPAEGQELLGRVQANSQRIEQTLEGFIRLLRVRNQPLNPTQVNMQELVQEVLQELQPTAPEAQVQPQPLPAALGDPVLLRQVWVNLIGNALKFSRQRQPPRIEIGAREESQRLVYFVKDNGTGFDPKEATQLWSAFNRLHDKTFEGSGLGLSVVRRIIQRHHGEVWAEAAPDQGATFYFSLPRPQLS